MLKEQFKKVLVGGVVLSVFSVSALPVGAASPTVGNEDGGATSYGHVILEAGGDEVTPPIVNPDPDGDGDGDGGENGGTGNTGSLRIDWVTPLEFGVQEIVAQEMTYATQSEDPFVQVSDFRGGGEGWSLTVEASAFTDKDDANKILKGATITLPEGLMVTSEDNVSDAPTAYGVELKTDSSSELIMDAAEKTGLGTWADRFEGKGEQVELTVPSGNYAGDYEAELTWTLMNVL